MYHLRRKKVRTMRGKERKRLKVPATGRLATMIKEADADGEPLIIDTGIAEYTVRIEETTTPPAMADVEGEGDARERVLWEGYDPERSLAIFDEVEGSWSDVDTDALIADIYRWREEGSRPAKRS